MTTRKRLTAGDLRRIQAAAEVLSVVEEGEVGELLASVAARVLGLRRAELARLG
jgi:hypothetical protein